MITKKQSKMLQGIAILLMMFHHFFTFPDDFLFNIHNVDAIQKAAWFAKICVGLFSFVSGYGMCIVLSEIRENVEKNILGKQYITILKRLIILILKFWFVLGVDVIFILCIKKQLLGTTEIINNAFFIDFSLNGSWWFIRQYIIFLLIAPMLEHFFKGIEKKGKKRIIFLAVAFLIGFLFVACKIFVPSMEGFFDFIQPYFIAVFIVGFALKYYEVFSIIERRLPQKTVIQVIIGMILIAAAATIRVILAKDPSFAKVDFILVPVFSLGVLLILAKARVISFILEQLGIYSTYMWLIHVTVYMETIDIILRVTNNVFVFFIIETILTFAVSWIFQTISTLVKLAERKVRSKKL